MQTNISIEDKASPALQKLLSNLLQRQPLLTRLGKTVEVELRNHFAEKESEPNKRGWPKQHFWARIRRATAFTGADNDKATVSIAAPAFLDKVNPAGVYTKAKGAYAIPLPASPPPLPHMLVSHS
ncbi:MAG: hypothetical protein LBV28_06075 [Puniceicoccales bacterium]|jgi:hypothetical protein|nr:hypothetical protein [Puniceicoccales bacterium]